MYIDSQCALRFIRNPELEDMRKRIDVILSHLRKRLDAVALDIFVLRGFLGLRTFADVFTQALPSPAFVRHRDSLSLAKVVDS
jgi:hypothetical protein